MEGEALLAGVLLGGVAAWAILALAGWWQERKAAREPAAEQPQHVGLSVRAVPGAVIVLLTVKTDHLVCQPEAAMKVGVGMKRAAAEAMGIRPWPAGEGP